jgi:Rieske 2Fe-2S family protein
MAAYRERESQWRPLAESLGTALPDYGSGSDPSVPGPGGSFGAAYRAPLREGYLTGTSDGQPAAPLMGGFAAYDSGETALGAGPLSYMLAYNDYATWFQFVPRDALRSDLIVTWLIAGGARPGVDFDEERVAWLWTVTSYQDKAIIEANAAGIVSPSYAPGPPGLLEQDVAGFRRWYLGQMGGSDTAQPAGGSRYFGF